MARKYKANREDFGGIRERNGRFQASYVHKGTRYYAPMTYNTKTDARAYLDGVRTDIARGVWISPKAVKAETFGLYAETCIARRIAADAMKPKTAQEYRRQLSKGLAVFAGDRVTDITTARVKAWHADRMSAAKTMAASEARTLRSILNEAVEDGIIAVCPVPSKLTRVSAGKVYRPPTLDELAILHDRVEDRYKIAVLIAAYGGLRMSEWRALRRSDLTLTDGRYVLRVERQAEHVTGHGWSVTTPKSKQGIRLCVLPKWLTAVMDAHLEARVGAFPDSLLFAPKGRSLFIHNSDFYKTWTPAQKAAGVKGQVREHDLRDFAGSHRLAAGANPLEVRDFLGHADVKTTVTHYLHVVNDREAELADKMPTLPAPKPSKVTKLPKTGS